MDGKTLGSVSIGESSSGPFSPVALAELANATGRAQVNMNRVIYRTSHHTRTDRSFQWPQDSEM